MHRTQPPIPAAVRQTSPATTVRHKLMIVRGLTVGMGRVWILLNHLSAYVTPGSQTHSVILALMSVKRLDV